MKRLFIFILLVVVLTGNVIAQMRDSRKNSVKPSVTETLVNYEKQTWELVKRKDLKTFADFIAEDFYGIYFDAENVTKPKLLEFLGAVDLRDYQLSDFRVTTLNKDAAIISYKADSRVMEDGKEVSSHIAVTSGWAKRSGKWLGVFYRENLLK